MVSLRVPARPLTDIPTKLLKQGFDVRQRQAAAYGTREDQLKGALVLPLHSSMVLPLGTSCGFRSTACWIRNSHHHPPEAALGRADAIAPGRVHDDVRRLELLKRLIGQRSASNELVGPRNSLRQHLARNQRRLQSRSTCHEMIGIHLKIYHAQVVDKRCVLYLGQKLGRCLFFLFVCLDSICLELVITLC